MFHGHVSFAKHDKMRIGLNHSFKEPILVVVWWMSRTNSSMAQYYGGEALKNHQN
jgi:hypothetical protein